MARIRSRIVSKPEKISDELIQSVVQAILEEDQEDGPVIFEIQVGRTNFVEVILVWDGWSDLSVDARTRIVQEAYDQASRRSTGVAGVDRISSVIPLTVVQALEMGVLPYNVQCGVSPGDASYEKIQDLMKSQGAINTGGELELRLPTVQLAREARDWLRNETSNISPDIHWQISEQVGRIIEH
jgi:hypothetical protein